MPALALIALLVPFLISTATTGDEYASLCDYSETRHGHFSSPNADDTLSVSVSGNPCYDGRFRVAIRNSNDQLLYEYETTIRSLTAPLDSDEALQDFARSLIKSTIDRAFSHSSSSLPDHNAVPSREAVVVSQLLYESIRERALPIFSHPAAEESWHVVVYDPESAAAIVILTGAL